MEMQKIEGSSTIAAIGYDQELQELTIQFHSGGTYSFAGVPEHEHQALISAPSVGRQFHQRIRGSYAANRLS